MAAVVCPRSCHQAFCLASHDIPSDFATEYGIPAESVLGGAETLYPECIKNMKTMQLESRTSTEHYKRAQ
jgi:hypothetical protein